MLAWLPPTHEIINLKHYGSFFNYLLSLKLSLAPILMAAFVLHHELVLYLLRAMLVFSELLQF